MTGFQSTLFRAGIETQLNSSQHATSMTGPTQQNYSQHSKAGGAATRASKDRSRHAELSDNSEEQGLTEGDLRPYEGESNATITSSRSAPKSELDEPARLDAMSGSQIQMTTEWSVLRSPQDAQDAVHRRQG